ncbi:LA_3751/LA_3752 family putative glycosyltransferase [Leptospira wolffii]|uniref:LA_3751/LA_3752 family putative glycosyltransferase n=1 Tax=Leptospira wolffii TaxID=409998 RepID=UPI00030DD19C|nr:hypothetical protein [Leptospira wolffii]EPG68043.1 putative membrane protein [Leptospira wolffii serovar Khorat str. Khorat-H2]
MKFWKEKLTPFALSNLICLLFVSFVFLKIPAESVLVADNQTKILQAQAFLDTGFQSQYSKCSILEGLGGCAYSPGGNGKDIPILIGVFPVAFSLFAALVRLTGDYTHLVYISVLFFLAGTWLLSLRIRKNFWIPVVLTFGPCFFHSFLFPDYAIVFFLIAVLVGFYYRPLFGKYSNFMVGLVSGSAVFFRPEVVFLPFLLSIFLVFRFFRTGFPKKDSEDAKRFYLLIGYGFSVFLFFLMNYVLYGNFLGTRIEANKTGMESFLDWEKYASLLFYGNGRVGFFLFSTWALIAILHLLFRIRDLEKKELLFATIISIFLILLLSPNDSNIDWGTRYLSWLTIPVSILYFGKDFGKTSLDKIWRKSVISLFALGFIVVYVFFRLQVKVSQEFQKYNSVLTNLSGEVSVVSEPSIIGFYGKDILEKKVLLIRRSEDKKEFVKFLSGKVSRLDLIQYEPVTYYLLEGMRQDGLERNEAILKKELLRQGWRLSEQRIAWKLEILSFVR